MDDNLEGMDDNLECMDDNLEGMDDNLEGMDDNLEGMDDNLECMDDNLEGMDDNLEGMDDNLEGMDDNQVQLVVEAVDARDDRVQSLLYKFLDTPTYSRHNTSTVITFTDDAVDIETWRFQDAQYLYGD